MSRAAGRGGIALGLAALLAACHQPPAPASGERVEAAAYDAFYLWPGVTPPPSVARARLLYLLDGEVRRGSGAFVPLRPQSPHLPDTPLWLVVRVERLDWPEPTYARVLGELARWQAAGNRVTGLQIDFDAATHGLSGYASFLADLRRRLPPRWRLSVTGLMDWSAHGDPAALAGLAGTLDEVVIQTYQGRSTIPGYETYLAKLRAFPLPYRIALVEHGQWREPPDLKRQKNFAGYVVFLVKGPRRD